MAALLIAGPSIVSAASADTTGATYNSDATVAFKASDKPSNPGNSQDPDSGDDDGSTPVNPDPDKPVNPGTAGPLSIDFASSFAFGTQDVSSSNETYYAHAQATANGNTEPDFVQVTDNRGTFAGWTLSVKTDSQFHLASAAANSTTPGDVLTGASLKFNKGNATAKADLLSQTPSIVPGTVVDSTEITTADTTIVSAAANQGMGTWFYRLGTNADYQENGGARLAASDVSSASPATLTVPGTTTKKAAAYTTNLVWTLSEVPAQ